MPRLSLEATFGIVLEIAVGIMDHLRLGLQVIWFLFAVGALLILDFLLRGEWAEKTTSCWICAAWF